jgi:hypothetical protein
VTPPATITVTSSIPSRRTETREPKDMRASRSDVTTRKASASSPVHRFRPANDRRSTADRPVSGFGTGHCTYALQGLREALIEHGQHIGELTEAIVATGWVSGELLGEPSAELRAQMADGPVGLFTLYQSM